MWKALHNRMFYMALLIGCTICASNLWQKAELAMEYLYNAEKYTLSNGMVWGGGDLDSLSVFKQWMGATEDTINSYIFWFLLPLLSGMAYGWKAQEERKNGYHNQMCIRVGRKNNSIAKYMASATAGGLTIAIPLICNVVFMATYMTIQKPYITPDTSGEILEVQFGSLLFFEQPVLYIVAAIGLATLWGSVFGGLTMAAGMLTKRRISAVLVPFLLCTLIEVIFSANILITEMEWSPRYLFHLQSIRATSGWIIFGEIMTVFILSFGMVLWKGQKDV